MTIERRERATYNDAIDEAVRRLILAGGDLSAAKAWERDEPALQQRRADAEADLAGLIGVQAALDEFEARPIHPARAASALHQWLDTLASGQQLLDELLPDPRRRFGPDPAMSLATADAIVAQWDAGGRELGDFHALMQFVPYSRADQDDLFQTARRRFENDVEPVAADQSVGVLIPLRLETRFKPPGGGGSPSWHLQLRVYPEEAAFDRQHGSPTAAEADYTREMWRACDGDLPSDQGKAAFRDLAAKVGGPRAAWLARTLPVIRPDPAGPTEVQAAEIRREEQRVFHTPRGLPPAIEIWIARGGATTKVADLSLDRAAIAEQADLDALFRNGVDPGDPDAPPPDTWWNSFEQAVQVGLGTVIDLGPDQPNDIEAIYAVALGPDEPLGLFAAHVAAGRLAVVPPGTPTNTVAGEPAADLGRDLETWWGLATSSGFEQAATRDLDLALLGGAGHLGPLPGGELDLRGLADALVAGLFPVLFGRWLKDVWGFGERVYDIGRWARRCLAPEGPFPAIRVGDQPYGVLPVTAPGRWAGHRTDPAVEAEALVRAFEPMLRRWAAVAEADGNVVGADTDRLLDLLSRTPTTELWAWRKLMPLDFLRAHALSAGSQRLLEAVERQWKRSVVGAYDDGLHPPNRRYVPYAYGHPLHPRFWSGEVARPIRKMLHTSNRELVGRPDPFWRDEDRPTPLLARLVRHALILTNAEINRFFEPDELPWRPELLPAIEEPQRLALLASREHRDVPEVEGDENLWRNQLRLDIDSWDITRSIDHPAAPAVARMWEAVRDGADVLSHEGYEPARILQALGALLDTASHRLDPWVTGLAWRRLRWLQDRDVPWRLGAYGWVDRPRPAERDELRPGPTPAGLLHAPSPAQALTAAILRDHAVRDRNVARWDITLDSAKVRTADRLAGQVRAGVHVKEALGRLVEEIAGDPGSVAWLRKTFPTRPEHDGRRVCDGERAVAEARANPAAFQARGIDASEVAALQDVLDTYSDLLVADAVFDVVSGRADRAAESMEAAAGFGPPSDLRVLRTPREGTGLSTAVLAVLPAAALPADGPPGAMADPVFAALLASETGDPAGARWTWRAGGQAVTLADLGLAPVDVVTIPAGALADRVRAVAGADIDAPVDGAAAVAEARALAALLGGSPGLPQTLLGFDDPGVLQPAVAALLARLAALTTAAGTLLASLEGGGGAAELAEAERWGIQPGGDTEADRVALAAETLNARLDDEAERAAGDAALSPTHDAVGALVERVHDLAGSSDLPVVLTAPRDALDPPDAQLTAADIDEPWLTIAAAVRPPLARLEARQLDPDRTRWTSWSTSPADPWLTDWIKDNRGNRNAPQHVVFYGPGQVLAGAEVGVVLLDRYSETVPSETHVTSAAFGFNGPKARAPQSILLAVPPDVTKPLDTETVVAILADTRRLTRARAATPQSLANASVPVPTPFLLGWEAGEHFANVDLVKLT